MYAMVKPKRSGSFAKRSMSGAFCRNSAKDFSNWLSAATRLKTVFFESVVGRDHGNDSQVKKMVCRELRRVLTHAPV